MIGPSGMGKTMLLEVMAASLGDRFRAVSLTASQLCTRRALLQAILYGLDLPYRDQEEGELRLALTQQLTDGLTLPNGMLLLVDECSR